MKTVFRQLSRLSAAAFSLFLFAFFAYGQYRAGIQGAVTDSAGALVPGAKVTLTSQETTISHTADTGDSGIYTIVGLAPGKYTLTVEKVGFGKKVMSDVQIGAEQVQAINVTLEVGQLTETVNISAAVVPEIDTESAMIAGTITDREIHDLPSIWPRPVSFDQARSGRLRRRHKLTWIQSRFGRRHIRG